MSILKSNFYYVLFLTVLFAVSSRGGNHTVSTTIEVTQTAINRYLNTQYNAAGFPKTISVSGGYTISLALPNILLSTDNAKLQMVFDVWQGSTLLYHFTIQPSVNIPSNQISASSIQAFLTNLQSSLDGVSGLPSWVKTNIMSNFNTRGWTMYPSKLLDTLSSQWFKKRGLSITVNDLALGWQVTTGALKLVVSIPMTATAPTFSAMAYLNAVVLKSNNIDVTVDEVRLYTIAQDLIASWTNDVPIIKSGLYYWSIGYSIAPQYVIVWVLFKTQDTFYVREFRCPAGQETWGSVTNSIN